MSRSDLTIETTKYRLTADAVSNLNREVYAKRGTEVSLISNLGDHVDTVIVKDAIGKCFPVRFEKLIEVKKD